MCKIIFLRINRIASERFHVWENDSYVLGFSQANIEGKTKNPSKAWGETLKPYEGAFSGVCSLELVAAEIMQNVAGESGHALACGRT